MILGSLLFPFIRRKPQDKKPTEVKPIITVATLDKPGAEEINTIAPFLAPETTSHLPVSSDPKEQKTEPTELSTGRNNPSPSKKFFELCLENEKSMLNGFLFSAQHMRYDLSERVAMSLSHGGTRVDEPAGDDPRDTSSNFKISLNLKDTIHDGELGYLGYLQFKNLLIKAINNSTYSIAWDGYVSLEETGRIRESAALCQLTYVIEALEDTDLNRSYDFILASNIHCFYLEKHTKEETFEGCSETHINFHFSPPISIDPNVQGYQEYTREPFPKTEQLAEALQRTGFFKQTSVIPLIVDYLRQDPSVKNHGVDAEDHIQWGIVCRKN